MATEPDNPKSPPVDIVTSWLTAEAEAAPDCPVLAAVKASTQVMKLDETALLRKLQELCEPATPPSNHVSR